ncbi:MAG: hypothetical protein OXF02_01270 [Simkaniaceae bacterium]|nr:hypothetical protein [Simkaniaceae bacterium]
MSTVVNKTVKTPLLNFPHSSSSSYGTTAGGSHVSGEALVRSSKTETAIKIVKSAKQLFGGKGKTLKSEKTRLIERR